MAEQKKTGCGCGGFLLLFVAITVICILVAGTGDEEPASPTYAHTYTTATTAPPADRLPGLDDSYEGHLFLDMKGYGDCTSLTGNILLTFLMVDDSESAWTEADLADFESTVHTATNELHADAREYGVQLTVVTQFIRCTSQGTLSMMDSQDWTKSALTSAGFDYATACSDSALQFGCDQAAFLLCVNRVGRSFANSSFGADGYEGAILYREHADYRHEVNHLFGAEDFYYPEEAKTLADQLLPNSIMNGAEDPVTDELTAYLIGWTDEPGPNAKAYLEQTAWITNEIMSKAYAEQTITGYHTKRWGEGTYTGDWVDGIPHGRGSIQWDDGNYYEGDWFNGSGHGQGTFYWSSGETYTGQVVNFGLEGYGTYRWADGTVYQGYWQNGQMHGQGTCTWSSGAVQSGTWENGKFIG